MCVLLGVFREFPVDPYYEPLAWFMIYIYMHTHIHIYIYIYIYINYMPIHAYIIPIHIYTHMHAPTSIYIHVHTCIAVHVYITFHLLMEGGMVRVYRILRVIPQPAINIAKICFVTNYGKLRNYNFLNNNVLYNLLGGIYGPQKDEHPERRASGCSYFSPNNYSGSY